MNAVKFALSIFVPRHFFDQLKNFPTDQKGVVKLLSDDFEAFPVATKTTKTKEREMGLYLVMVDSIYIR